MTSACNLGPAYLFSATQCRYPTLYDVIPWPALGFASPPSFNFVRGENSTVDHSFPRNIRLIVMNYEEEFGRAARSPHPHLVRKHSYLTLYVAPRKFLRHKIPARPGHFLKLKLARSFIGPPLIRSRQTCVKIQDTNEPRIVVRHRSSRSEKFSLREPKASSWMQMESLIPLSYLGIRLDWIRQSAKW
jgi:hypothetical protein